MRLVTFTTDFDPRDGFAGTMAGVVAARAPRALPVTLAAGIAPGDVRAAAFVLMTAAPWFAPGTVHVAVVDPGVGTARRPLAFLAGGQWFVGPDNGVLTWAAPHPQAAVVLANPRGRAARVSRWSGSGGGELRDSRWLRHPAVNRGSGSGSGEHHDSLRLRRPAVSRTFHGRDVFAPAAAALAAGVPLARLGSPATDWVRLPFPRSRAAGGVLRGEVLLADGFGNLVTNLAEADARARWGSRPLAARAAGLRWPVREAYGAVRPGARLAVFGSAGFLELSVRDGRAAAARGTRRGAPVALAPA